MADKLPHTYLFGLHRAGRGTFTDTRALLAAQLVEQGIPGSSRQLSLPGPTSKVSLT